jgi:hypothetical protein
MKPLKRIYYIPGILTLILAPVIIMVKTNKYVSERKEYCISIIMIPNDDNQYAKEDLLPKRDYQTFELTGQSKTDSLQILFIENYARGISLSKNDSIGIKVILNERLKYKNYIDLLNSCLKSDISDWIPWGDTLFIFNKEYPIDYDRKFCQNTLYFSDFINWGSDCIVVNKEPKFSIIQWFIYYKSLIIKSAPFLILLLILVYQNIIFIIKTRANT